MIRWLASMRAPAAAGVCVLAVITLLGCATPQVARLDEGWPGDLPARVELTHVPFFPQEEYQCGPAALAMVSGAAGVDITPQALIEQVFLPARKGSVQQEMLAATRRQGLLAYPVRPEVEAVLREVAAGNPVLVFQNLAFPVFPVWHYAVVTGFDRDRNVLVMHSGVTERLEVSLFAFERTWARANYWAMLALAPKRLPATVEAPVYVAAAAALERVNPRAAQTAYGLALQRWPSDRVALLGTGNAAYALGERNTALAAYRKATTHHPDFAEAWNNLAQVLLENGEVAQSGVAIAKAVALGGARLPDYLSLAQQIQEKLASSPLQH